MWLSIYGTGILTSYYKACKLPAQLGRIPEDFMGIGRYGDSYQKLEQQKWPEKAQNIS
jgi:hypothetical protein